MTSLTQNAITPPFYLLLLCPRFVSTLPYLYVDSYTSMHAHDACVALYQEYITLNNVTPPLA